MRISAAARGTSSTFNNSRHIYVLDIKNGQGSVDGVVFNTFDGSSFSSSQNWQIFGTLWSGAISFKISARVFKTIIYNNGYAVSILIPAKHNSKGEVGMYDIIRHTFFVSTISPFIAGPVV